jgi:hypothetical protein
MIRAGLVNRKRPFNPLQYNRCNIYIEIGDSNAGGPVLEPVGFPSYYQLSDRVRILYRPDFVDGFSFYSPENVVNHDASWLLYRTRDPINRRPGYIAATEAVGADQSLVYTLGNSTLKHDLRYYKFGIGGSTLIQVAGLDNDWSPDHTTGPTLELFTWFTKDFFRPGLALLAREGIKDHDVKGVVVRLGTNDCKTANWNQASFIAAIPNFVTRLRDVIGATVPIYWVQVHADLASAPGALWNGTNVTQCRTAISNCASGGSTEISNFFVLNYDADTLDADGVHYSPDSFISQGEDQANIFIALGD